MGYNVTLTFDSMHDVSLWLSFDERRFLQGGAGVHRLTLALKIDARGTLPAGTPIALGGSAWLTTGSREYLGQWATESPITVYDKPSSETLVLALTDDQVAIIEQRRAKNGGGFNIELEVDALLTSGLPARSFEPPRRASWWLRRAPAPEPVITGWPKAHSNHSVYFTSGQWSEMLAGINAYASLAVVAPLPALDPDAHAVATHLREAIRLVANGDVTQGVTEARRAIEALDAVFGTPDRGKKAIREIAEITPESRTLSERVALLEHALFSLASPAAHADPDAATFHWNRERAKLVVASVAALAACRSDIKQ
ncbi:hypothetical protein ACSNN9_07385 [Micromonospora sp. URMC 107]|uniref:hypothetical protein n=1 Tax=Micromonospora sp. URMC 107 TaxID=3423418 RepID=UPI003F1AE4F0